MKLQLTEWHRETFAVPVYKHPGYSPEDHAALVRGHVSGPFGVYAGTLYYAGHQSHGRKMYSLIHMPSQNVPLSLPREGLCRQAAEELAQCDLDWSSAWTLGVVGPIEEMEKAGEIYKKWRRWGEKR